MEQTKGAFVSNPTEESACEACRLALDTAKSRPESVTAVTLHYK